MNALFFYRWFDARALFGIGILMAVLWVCSCNQVPREGLSTVSASLFLQNDLTKLEVVDSLPQADSARMIHVFVALCDNQYQGIVPVPKGIGNGQDPATNLYWGCGFGIKTFFKKSAEWQLVQSERPDSLIIERLLFKHKTQDVYLLAEAYNGQYIERCTRDFLSASSGALQRRIAKDGTFLSFGGQSELLAYIGHDGLMDFEISETFAARNTRKRNTIILACYSKHYFSPHLKQAGVEPLVWTTGLMAPEAYTLHDALTSYVAGENAEAIRTRAAKAYSRYQKCSEKAARGLLVTGW